MGLLDRLTNNGSNLSEFDGATPPTPDFPGSRLHNQYSINGRPNVVGKPNPSTLDLDGETPPKYSDNLPG